MSFVASFARSQYLASAVMQFEGQVAAIDQNIFLITNAIFQTSQQLTEADAPGSPREQQIQNRLRSLALMSDKLQMEKRRLQTITKQMEAELKSADELTKKKIDSFKLFA